MLKKVSIWNKRKCDYCKTKYNRKDGYTIEVACLDDEGNPTKFSKKVCPSCAEFVGVLGDIVDKI